MQRKTEQSRALFALLQLSQLRICVGVCVCVCLQTKNKTRTMEYRIPTYLTYWFREKKLVFKSRSSFTIWPFFNFSEFQIAIYLEFDLSVCSFSTWTYSIVLDITLFSLVAVKWFRRDLVFAIKSLLKGKRGKGSHRDGLVLFLEHERSVFLSTIVPVPSYPKTRFKLESNLSVPPIPPLEPSHQTCLLTSRRKSFLPNTGRLHWWLRKKSPRGWPKSFLSFRTCHEFRQILVNEPWWESDIPKKTRY